MNITGLLASATGNIHVNVWNFNTTYFVQLQKTDIHQSSSTF